MMNQIKNFFVLFIFFGTAIAQSNNHNNGGGGGNPDPCAGLAVSYQPALILMHQENNVAQRLTVSRTATTGTCNFLVFIENVPGATDTNRFLTHGSNRVPIQFYTSAGHTNIVKSAAGAGSAAEAMSGVLSAPSTSMDVYYYPYINIAAINVPAGNPYTERYDFSLYTWNGNGFNSKSRITTNASTNYKYQVDDSMSLSLVNDGSLYNAADVTQTLDFGSLTTGESLGFDLWLVYTNGYKLSLSSTNGGNLKNSAVATSNLVPYTLSLDNVNVALSSVEAPVKTGTGASPSGGTKVDVNVTIGNVGTVFAGTYNDYVTFKISAP